MLDKGKKVYLYYEKEDYKGNSDLKNFLTSW